MREHFNKRLRRLATGIYSQEAGREMERGREGEGESERGEEGEGKGRRAGREGEVLSLLC